jgi:hypothetical protein
VVFVARVPGQEGALCGADPPRKRVRDLYSNPCTALAWLRLCFIVLLCFCCLTSKLAVVQGSLPTSKLNLKLAMLFKFLEQIELWPQLWWPLPLQVHVLAPHGPVLVCGPCGPHDREVPRSGGPDGVLRQGERTLSLMLRGSKYLLMNVNLDLKT